MNQFRFDDNFDYFLEKFGEPHDATPIPEAVIEAYRSKLPERLFFYWRSMGTCGFCNGLLWMTNPSEYQDLLDSWLEGTAFENRNDLSVIARTAFGELLVWGKGKGEVFEINPNLNLIYRRLNNESENLSAEAENKHMMYFWGGKKTSSFDATDEIEKPMFEKALKKLGQLKSDEMYGYKHRLALGGKELISNLHIVKLEVYHDIAQQMEPPQIIEFE